jgi:hypothetical protein
VRLTGAALALALAALAAPPAAADEDWEIERSTGECVEVWRARHLVRGPIAILNGVLRPVTSFVGGVWFAVAECHHDLRCLWIGPLWVAGSTGWGLGEGLHWIVTGLLDTPTFGTAPFSPFPASRLQLGPVVPFIESHPPGDAERCPR